MCGIYEEFFVSNKGSDLTLAPEQVKKNLSEAMSSMQKKISNEKIEIRVSLSDLTEVEIQELLIASRVVSTTARELNILREQQYHDLLVKRKNNVKGLINKSDKEITEIADIKANRILNLDDEKFTDNYINFRKSKKILFHAKKYIMVEYLYNRLINMTPEENALILKLREGLKSKYKKNPEKFTNFLVIDKYFLKVNELSAYEQAISAYSEKIKELDVAEENNDSNTGRIMSRYNQNVTRELRMLNLGAR